MLAGIADPMGSQRSAADLLAAYDENFVGFAGSTEFLEKSADVTGGAPDGSLDPDNLYESYDTLLRAFMDAHPELGELNALVLSTEFEDSDDDCGDNGDCTTCGGAVSNSEGAPDSYAYMDEAADEEATFSSAIVPPASFTEPQEEVHPTDNDIFRFVVDA